MGDEESRFVNEDTITVTVGICQWVELSRGRFILEEDLKVAGEVWRVHKNDPDPFPSRPHAHCIAGPVRFVGCKLHLGTGELFNGKTSLRRALNKPQFERLLELIREKYPDLKMPLSDQGDDEADYDLVAIRDSDDAQIHEFCAAISRGGEVMEEGLEIRIRERGELVAIKRIATDIIGIAALKSPTNHHRQITAQGAQFDLNPSTYPYELGWAFVDPAYRGKRIAERLCGVLIEAKEGSGLFATTRAGNDAMQSVLRKKGFYSVGRQYPSARGKYNLQLFIRTPRLRNS
jgi:GNAT superfamily N-acetyltransferase